jgi:hypothetical protein
MLNATHSHCTPVLKDMLYDVYVDMPQSQHAVIDAYTSHLETTLIDTVVSALGSLQPATVFAGQGKSHFAVNRRENPEPTIEERRARGESLRGPVDHSVPVLVVRNEKGIIQAIMCAYACHNTVLNFYEWCGDYAGFTQIALERNHPEATALFVMGCGADQNPLPRRSVALAQRYGEMLAAAVEEAILHSVTTLKAHIDVVVDYAVLRYAGVPTDEELEKIAAVAPGEKLTCPSKWARRILSEKKSGVSFPSTYSCPMQVWRLGGSQLWIAMSGEVVVDYSVRFKAEFGENVWVTAYANDVFGYIPSARILGEDKWPPRCTGYEGNTGMYVYGLPALRWAEDVEHVVGECIRKLVRSIQEKKS